VEHRHTVGVGALFGIVYATSVSSVYFALGVVAHHANGLTPEVFIAAGVFFQLTAMTYTEGSALHPEERGGSAAFARHAFNELVSFIAGWAIVLDYTILVAVTAITTPAYLAVFWPTLGHGVGQLIAALLIVAGVTAINLRGLNVARLRRWLVVTAADLALQAAMVVLGLILIFHGSHLVHAVHVGSAPSLSDLGFALPVAVIAFAGLESASGIAAEVSAKPRDLRRLVSFGSGAIILVYVGIAVVGVAALPVTNGVTELGTKHIDAPMIGIAEAFHPQWLADTLKYLTAVAAGLGLPLAGTVAMLGVSRVGYSLATNRQIPSSVGRLSNRWGTPWVVIGAAGIAAAALAVPTNLELLVGIYAFGALVAFTIAHLSVIVMRFREPDLERAYRIPLSVPYRGAQVPVPAVMGAVLSAAGLVALIIFHSGARYVGIGWLLAGITLYLTYRRVEHKPILRRVTIPERALRHESAEHEFGSILVPLFGTPLDDDIIQTAGRLAGETRDELEEEGATIEAIWVFEIPLALPLDAPIAEARTDAARAALSRAKEVGEEYEGVEVATAMVRARRTGHAIVSEAKRRGVELIVLGAEEPSGIRGGGLLGASGPLENYVGEVAKYVINKAPCRVVLTAPPADWRERFEPGSTLDTAAQPDLAPEADLDDLDDAPEALTDHAADSAGGSAAAGDDRG
jgi:APA family basic amino acid/polyamine antiporter